MINECFKCCPCPESFLHTVNEKEYSWCYCLVFQVEVVAVPVTTGEEGNQGKPRRVSQHVPDNMTFGGHPQPSLDVPYQVSIKDKMCYCAITMIKVRTHSLVVTAACVTVCLAVLHVHFENMLSRHCRFHMLKISVVERLYCVVMIN